MGKALLNKDNEFLVGEDRAMDIILAILFSAIFIYGIADAAFNEFTNIKVVNFIFIAFGIPAFVYIGNTRSRRIYIRVNKKGIYQDEELVTDWSNFLHAYIDQKVVVGGYQDNFILVVEHRKDGLEQGFRRKIPLTDTQNKSEEEVLEAVQFFSETYTNSAPDVIQ